MNWGRRSLWLQVGMVGLCVGTGTLAGLALAGSWMGGLVVTMLATMLFLSVQQRSAFDRLTAENTALARSVNLLELTENLAGVGRWRYDPACDLHHWSPEMCALAGIDPPRQPDAALLRNLLGPEQGGLAASLAHHATDREPYTIEFEIVTPAGEARLLRARVRNEFGPDGTRRRVLMVARNVTEEYEQTRRLKVAQAMALDSARRAQELANTDSLTGLANRRHAMARIDKAIMQARRTGAPLSLVVFDLDHFKAVNDINGHLIGDRVLAQVARVTTMILSKNEFAARFGGEEFVCLLEGKGAEAAAAFGEKLRWAIEIDSSVGDLPPVTASIGIATFDPADSSLSLFARADAALYEAKQGGRNQVRQAA